MPEIGQSGSEGGGAQANARPLPLSAAASEKKPTQEDSKASRVAEASSFGLPEQDAPATTGSHERKLTPRNDPSPKAPPEERPGAERQPGEGR